MAEEVVGKRQFRFHEENLVPFDACQSYLNKLGVTDVKIQDIVGIHASTISNWRREGKAPKYFMAALEGLVRRNAQSGSIKAEEPAMIVIKSVSQEDQAALELLLERMRLNFVKI